MALNVCLEAFFRIFFELLKYSVDNFIFVGLTVLAFSIIFKFFKKIGAIGFAVAGMGINFGLDTLLVSTFGLSIIISGIGAILIGLFWAGIPLSRDDVNPIIRYINALIFFLAGMIIGPSPDFLLSVSILILAIPIQFSRTANYFMGFLVLAILYYLSSIASPVITAACSITNYFLT